MTQNLFATYHNDELPTFDQWLSAASTSLKGSPLEKIARAAQRGGLAWDTLSCDLNTNSEGPSALFTAHPVRTVLAQVYDVSASSSPEHLRAINAVLLQDLENGVWEIRLRTQGTQPIPHSVWAQVLDGVYTELVHLTVPAKQTGSLQTFLEHSKKSIEGSHTPHSFQTVADALSSPGAGVDESSTLKQGLPTQTNSQSPIPPPGILLNTAQIADYGGSDVFELATLLAWSAESLQVGLTDALPQGVLMSLRSHTLGSICKIRAARHLWAVFTAQRLGQPKPLILCTETARHEISCTDTWTNLLRLTAQTAAALIGGADRHAVLPHDSRRATPNPFGHRLARNVMHILQKECHLDAFEDPVAGAWAFEAHTQKLSQAAWDLFLNIEQKGGWSLFLSSGKVHELLRSSRTDLIRAERQRLPGVLGVSSFANTQEATELQHHEHPDALQPEPTAKEPPSAQPESILYLSDVFGFLQTQVQKDWPYRNRENKPIYDLIQIGNLKELSARLSWTVNALAAGALTPGRRLIANSVDALDQLLKGEASEGAQPKDPPSALAVLVATDETLSCDLDAIETMLAQCKSIRHLIVAGRISSERSRPCGTPVRIDAVLNMKSDLYDILDTARKVCRKSPLET